MSVTTSPRPDDNHASFAWVTVVLHALTGAACHWPRKAYVRLLLLVATVTFGLWGAAVLAFLIRA